MNICFLCKNICSECSKCRVPLTSSQCINEAQLHPDEDQLQLAAMKCLCHLAFENDIACRELSDRNVLDALMAAAAVLGAGRPEGRGRSHGTDHRRRSTVDDRWSGRCQSTFAHLPCRSTSTRKANPHEFTRNSQVVE